MRADHLILVGDSGFFRAYRTSEARRGREPELVLVDELSLGALEHSAPAGTGGHVVLERRFIETIAKRINTLLADENVAGCSLSLNPAVQGGVLRAIASEHRAKIHQVVPMDAPQAEPVGLRAHPGRFNGSISASQLE